MINKDNAKLIGTGKWIKNSAYMIYELDEKYYSVLVTDQWNREIEDWSITEIKFEDIEKYI
jgi:hypothetical protein